MRSGAFAQSTRGVGWCPCNARKRITPAALPREEVKRLNELFYRAADGPPSLQEAASATLQVVPAPGSRLQRLPLWRVEWAVLPFAQGILHVHAPHYAHMFEALFAQQQQEPHPAPPSPGQQQQQQQPSPALPPPQQQRILFGHLLLPSGSRNLSNPEYALTPGSQAPLVGVLMQVDRSVRLIDGKLLVLATGVARFKVVHCHQQLPYSVADVELLLDEEAVAGWGPAATDALLRHAGDGAGVEALLAAVPMVAAAGAAAAAWQWLDGYELAVSRQQSWEGTQPREGTGEMDTVLLVQELAAFGVADVLPLPDGVVIGRRELEPLAAAADADARRAMDAAAAAVVVAAAARLEGDGMGEAGAGSEQAAPLSPAAGTLAAGATDAEGGPGAGADTRASSSGNASAGSGSSADVVAAEVLELEMQVWQELDILAGLAMRVRNNRLLLPFGLLQLRPPEPDAGAAAAAVPLPAQFNGAASDGLDVHAHPRYPPLRRAAKLSYAVAAALLEASQVEVRQQLLECTSVAGRLHIVRGLLSQHRKVLAALAAVKGIEPPRQPPPSTPPQQP